MGPEPGRPVSPERRVSQEQRQVFRLQVLRAWRQPAQRVSPQQVRVFFQAEQQPAFLQTAMMLVQELPALLGLELGQEASQQRR